MLFNQKKVARTIEPLREKNTPLFDMTKNEIKYLFGIIAYRLLLVIIMSYSINLAHPDRSITKYIGFKANDYGYFIPPAENLFNGGNYSYRDNMPYAGRMPGYAALYLAFRPFASQNASLLLMILFQTILGGLGAFLLAKSAAILFKNRKAFLVAYILGFIYPVSVFFDYQTLSEGLTISLLSITIYLIIKGLKSKWIIILIGLILAWIVFLRPFLGLLMPLWGIYLLWRTKGSIFLKLKYAFLGILPFMILISSWTVRNYYHFDKFIPLQTANEVSYGKIYSKGWMEIRSLISAWGGEAAYFEPGSEAEWFRKNTTDAPPPLPESFFNEVSFSQEDLISLKLDYQQFMNTSGYDSVMDNRIVNKASFLLQELHENQTIIDKAVVLFSHLKRLTFKHGSAYMPTLFNKKLDLGLRVIFSLSYLLIIFLAIISIVVTKGKLLTLFIPVAITIAGLLVASTIYEFRYFLSTFPFIILLTTGGLIWLLENLAILKRTVLLTK